MVTDALEAEKFIRLLTIYNKQKNRLDFMDPNRAQLDLLSKLQNHNRVIVIKARQMGISTLCRAWHFYQAYHAVHPWTFAVVSHTADSAKHIAHMDRTFYRNLPKALRKPLEHSTGRMMSFKESGSSVRSYSAGGKGGTRSFTAHAAHLSEFAFVGTRDDQEELLAQVTATVGEGQIILESTANKPGDLFHHLALDALAGKNDWCLAFYPWTWDPSYAWKNGVQNLMWQTNERKYAEAHNLTKAQAAWRRKQLRLLGHGKFKREYPCTLEEAFQAAFVAFFDHEKLNRIQPREFSGRERIYRDPGLNEEFVMGVDVGAGSGGDYSAITVVSTETRQPVYHYLSNEIPATRFTELIIDKAARFGNPEIILEAQASGLVVLDRLEQAGYPSIYREGNRPYRTTTTTRPLLFSGLQQIIDEELLVEADTDLIHQLKQCLVLKGRPDHPRNSNDDLLISCALAYYAMRRIPLNVERNWRRSIIEEAKAKGRARRARRRLPWDARGSTRRRL